MEAVPLEYKLGFARKLASPKKKAREKAISLLVLWLTSQTQLEEKELRKVWKGLFYCVWHSDKAPVQADLIERLASILEKLDVGLALKFFKVFLTTMRREWAGIDRLRLDKFYLLLRKFLAHMFTALQTTGWLSDCTKNFLAVLLENGFLAKDLYIASGINLYYADIYLQELEKFLPLGVDTFKLLIEPFLVVCAHAFDKSLHQRIKDSIFDRLFDLGRLVITAKQEGHALDLVAETLGSLFISVRLGDEAFKLASLPSTSQANRKILYSLYTEYDKLEKLFETSGVLLSLPTVAVKAKKKKKKVKSLGPLFPSGKPAQKGAQHNVVKPSKKRKKLALDEDMKLARAFDFPKSKEDESMQTDLREGNEVCALEITDQDKAMKRKKGRSAKQQKVALVDMGAHKDPLRSSDGLGMDSSVILKLEEQFDMLAGGAPDVWITPDFEKLNTVSPHMSGKPKRKRLTSAASIDNRILVPPLSSDDKDATPNAAGGGKSSGKVKKVRFALKKNLVWTPFTPLPAGVVRIPPSATPRGSALKKGVPPGPIVFETANRSKQRKDNLFWSSTPRKVKRQMMDHVKVFY